MVISVMVVDDLGHIGELDGDRFVALIDDGNRQSWSMQSNQR